MKTRFLIKALITTLIFSLILFICAGKIKYFQGWIFLVTNVLTASMNFWTIRNEPELMIERSKVGEGVKFLSARKENKFFSSVVRIQADRGHEVCNTGIYKIVRHLGYLGMILSLSGFPLITGSLWSTTTTATAIILLIIRTFKEDEALKNELSGYTEYVQKTKQLLIPKIW